MRRLYLAVITLTAILLVAFVFFMKSYPPQAPSFAIKNVELVNSLEYIRHSGFNDEWDASTYVILKNWLESPIENKQEVVDYLDNKQWDDGGWGYRNGLRPMMSRAVLLAYVMLNATPKKTLDPFFSNYNTWDKVLSYHPGYERMDKYHLVYSWVAYYGSYPPWMPQLFAFYEENLDWTTGNDTHERSHILYSYQIARRTCPNLDGIINATLALQRADGSWSVQFPETSIQVHLLTVIKILYPQHSRIPEIQNAIDKAKPYIESAYRTKTLGGKSCGYFVDPATEKPMFDRLIDNVFISTLGAILTGLTNGNADPLFNSLYSRIG